EQLDGPARAGRHDGDRLVPRRGRLGIGLLAQHAHRIVVGVLLRHRQQREVAARAGEHVDRDLVRALAAHRAGRRAQRRARRRPGAPTLRLRRCAPVHFRTAGSLKNSTSALLNAAGSCHSAKWLVSLNTTSLPFGITDAISLIWSIRMISSWSPSATRVGAW